MEQNTFSLANGYFNDEQLMDMLNGLVKSQKNFYSIQAWIAKQRYENDGSEFYKKIGELEEYRKQIKVFINKTHKKTLEAKIVIYIKD